MIKKIKEHLVLSQIVAGIILYLSVLGLALVTDPEFLPGRSENLIHYSDFYVYAGSGSRVTETTLEFSENQSESVFSAALPTTKMEEITVEFVVDCPEICQGAVLHVDVLGENYDRAEQEFTVALDQGINKVSESIFITGNVPNELQLRIFTLEPAEYSLTELSVTTAVPAYRPVGTVIALAFTVISAGACIALLGYKIIRKKK